jgi:DNA repair exonuclease SbcCD ATPase subunit
MDKTTSVISSLKGLYQSLQGKQRKETKEAQTAEEEKRALTGFNLLPKKIVRKIFLFLDFATDGAQVYVTCKLFCNTIRSRVFQNLLQSQASKDPKTAIDPATTNPEEIFGKLKPESEIKTKEEAIAQLKTAEAIKEFLANKIKKQHNKNNELEKETNSIREEIAKQKALHLKAIERTQDFEKMIENERKSLAEAQKALAGLQGKCGNDLEPLKMQIANSERDRNELQETKRVQKEAVLKLREENYELQKKIVVYQEVLNKIKAYFEGMEEANLLPLDS